MFKIIDKRNISIENQLFIKPDYLNHPHISGNKYRKLKYNILTARHEKYKVLLTFGGAFSNHIAAVAAAGREFGFKTIGVIRGEELADKVDENPTLSFAKSMGMTFMFISRSDYRKKRAADFLEHLKTKAGDFYLIPEGGTNDLAVKGCAEILTEEDKAFDYICCPVGTGGTISGLINSSYPHQKVLGFPALKENFLDKEIKAFVNKDNWDLVRDYHFGGYAKINTALIEFINKFKDSYKVPLDPVYTGKMLFGVTDMLNKGVLPKDAKILAIHTGGLQGIEGMNIRLKMKGLPIINN
jgi:1-aminocyclopropane-1-carboxylate deaminase